MQWVLVRWVAAAAGAAAALASHSVAARDVPKTKCNPAQLGRELSGYVIQGVPLLGGIRTGMSREQARRIAPRLSLSESRQRLELFPGLSFRATAMFHNFFGEVEWIRLFGSSRDIPIEPLTAHYGKPVTLDLSNSGYERVRVLKWCDRQRVFLLTERPDRFGLIVTAERLHR